MALKVIQDVPEEGGARINSLPLMVSQLTSTGLYLRQSATAATTAHSSTFWTQSYFNRNVESVESFIEESFVGSTTKETVIELCNIIDSERAGVLCHVIAPVANVLAEGGVYVKCTVVADEITYEAEVYTGGKASRIVFGLVDGGSGATTSGQDVTFLESGYGNYGIATLAHKSRVLKEGAGIPFNKSLKVTLSMGAGSWSTNLYSKNAGCSIVYGSMKGDLL